MRDSLRIGFLLGFVSVMFCLVYCIVKQQEYEKGCGNGSNIMVTMFSGIAGQLVSAFLIYKFG